MPTIETHSDGGCFPNPGTKYGSFEVLLDGVSVKKVLRQSLGHGTNNEAEWEIIIEALHWTLNALTEGGFSAIDYNIKMFTDSEIVRNRLMKKNKIFKKYPESSKRMFDLANRVLGLLIKFKSFNVTWESREFNVARFGH